MSGSSSVRVEEAYGLAEAKDRFSSLTALSNQTGRPFTVLKNGKPWVEVRPLSKSAEQEITIEPVRHRVVIANLDDLFKDYKGDYVPQEDGLASPAGLEEL